MDFVGYRNHVYRVYHLSLHLSDDEQEELFAIAAAFHDLGIWSAHTWDYLPPSIKEAETWLLNQGEEKSVEAIGLVIDFHHRVGKYTGKYASWVEPFRRADWLDLTIGLRYGKSNRKFYRELKKAFPYRGFHRRLVVFFFRNLIRHPLKPLPMFR